MENLLSYWPLAAGFVAFIVVAASYKLWLRLFGVVIVPNDTVGLVNKKFVLLGSNRTLPDGRIIALNGEAGWQADTLAPGLHWGLWPWQYTVEMKGLAVIPEGKIGVVESRDGSPLSGGHVLGKDVPCDAFQNAREFLKNGGERGPQLTIIPPGSYRINAKLFDVKLAEAVEIPDNKIGIVTTQEGAALSGGDIAGKVVEGHNGYQNAQAFLDAGGSKGRQEQVLLAGRYFINPYFATVELADLTTVPIAQVGVVIAFVGKEGKDVTGESFKHGNLVSRGEKGVWAEPLDPGKYPINPFTHKVELVPTANVVLNWATGKTESHKLDQNLSTITVRSSDGFRFNLDVSQIIHIPRNEAPKVIARFGSMQNLVTQVLEPTIGNYFRNAAQNSDAISFLKERTKRQNEAKTAIDGALNDYNVGAVDTLIGDIVPPEELMKTLTDRKIAEQEQVTYQTQRDAEKVRQELQQAKALADTQATVVLSERKVSIAEFEANAAVKKAEGEAKSRVVSAEGESKSKTIMATADANVLKTVGEAEAEKTRLVGTAEADVIKLKIDSVQSDNYAIIETAKALAAAGIPLVPQIVTGGGADGHGSGLVDVLLANLITSPNGNGRVTTQKK